MAPKKGAEAPPPEAAAPDPNAEDPWETHELVCGIIDDLVATSTSVKAEDVAEGALHPHPLAVALREKELRAGAKAFTLNALEAHLLSALEVEFIDYDIGEPAGASNWDVGEEPVPCPIDSWSRGALPIKAPKPVPSLPPAPAEPPPKSPRRPGTSGSMGGAPSTAPGMGATGAGNKDPIFVAKPPEGYVAPVVKKVAPIVTAAERKAKRLDAEAREERERLERLKADLKGREYTYDARGNIIVMEAMSADRLPAFQQQPRLGLAAEKPNARKKALGKGGGKALGRIEFGNSATFKQLDSLQPPVTETMAVERGVLLRQGESTKGGEPREFDGERISRATFEELANSTGGFTARRQIASDAAATTTNAVEMPPSSPSKAPPMTMPPGGSASPALRPPSMPPSPENVTGMRNPSVRERGGMPTKTKLPPPSLGATTGHGQSLPYATMPAGDAPAAPPAARPAMRPGKAAGQYL